MKVIFCLFFGFMGVENLWAGKNKPFLGSMALPEKMKSTIPPSSSIPKESGYKTPDKNFESQGELRSVTPLASSAKKYGNLKQYIAGLLEACKFYPKLIKVIEEGEKSLEKRVQESCDSLYIPSFTKKIFSNYHKNHNFKKLQEIESQMMQEVMTSIEERLSASSAELNLVLAELNSLTSLKVDEFFESYLEKRTLPIKGIFGLRDKAWASVQSLSHILTPLKLGPTLAGLKAISYEDLKNFTSEKLNPLLEQLPELSCVLSLPKKLSSLETEVLAFKTQEKYFKDLK